LRLINKMSESFLHRMHTPVQEDETDTSA